MPAFTGSAEFGKLFREGTEQDPQGRARIRENIDCRTNETPCPKRTGRLAGRGAVPLRPGLAVPEEGVRGHPGGIRDGPVDVAEGQLPRQLGHGELLRAAEGRDVLRRGGTLQRLRKPEEGPQGLHRMVQLKPAERVPPLEIASGGSFQFRYSLITYP